jgi:D-3-phosphoglycerate dehydrogenase
MGLFKRLLAKLGLKKPATLSADMRAGRWQRLPLRSLGECTLGVVGLGNAGQAVARRANAFGMRVLATTLPVVGGGTASESVASVVTLETLLTDSDFVTLHADLRADNVHLMNATTLRLLKPHAVLINTARGRLVDEQALVAALRERRMGGAALDVFENEPLPPDSPLRSLDNVYLAPHNANASSAAAERVHRISIKNVIEVLENSKGP